MRSYHIDMWCCISTNLLFVLIKVWSVQFLHFSNRSRLVSFSLNIVEFDLSDLQKSNPLTIDITSDLKRTDKSLAMFVNKQVKKESSQWKSYVDRIHISPLKVILFWSYINHFKFLLFSLSLKQIHVSFSMHGSKLNDKLLVEYPLADFCLQLFNVAEAEDVVLK